MAFELPPHPTPRLTDLLGFAPYQPHTPEEKAFVGYVYRMTYNECWIQTNDAFKHHVGGVPHNCFLIATNISNHSHSPDPEDQEIVLLRVLGAETLPNGAQAELARIEHMQRRKKNDAYDATSLDPITSNDLQWGAFRCRVLGTFYIKKNPQTSEHHLHLGADLENFMTNSYLKVYKPSQKALDLIINHVNEEAKRKTIQEAQLVGFLRPPSPLDIGHVRYTSSTRLQQMHHHHYAVQVNIQPSDFLARRTAVLGMTRTGKSNMIKTMVSAVAMSGIHGDVRIGQVIFDVNGEYANANTQDDGSSLAKVFGDRVVRYRANSTPGFEDLRTNFFEQPEVALQLLNVLTEPDRGNAIDITNVFAANLYYPDLVAEKPMYLKTSVYRAAWACVLYEAGYKPHPHFRVKFYLNKGIDAEVRQVVPNLPPLNTHDDGCPFLELTLDEAVVWFSELRSLHHKRKLPKNSSGRDWVDGQLEAFLNVLKCEKPDGSGIRGYRSLSPFVSYHSPQRLGDVVDDVLYHLSEGKIVILDLSVGPVSIRKTLSERLARAIFDNQMNILNQGKAPPNVVIYVEEAHNLINRSADLDTTWPRIAKEGAKARMAFVYATQEPSSIHPNILSNTENWFVTHLNNDDELRTLSKYYDFSDFSHSLKMAQDVGFARVKTLSSPFTIPTQIKQFKPEEITHILSSKPPYTALSTKPFQRSFRPFVPHSEQPHVSGHAERKVASAKPPTPNGAGAQQGSSGNSTSTSSSTSRWGRKPDPKET